MQRKLIFLYSLLFFIITSCQDNNDKDTIFIADEILNGWLSYKSPCSYSLYSYPNDSIQKVEPFKSGYDEHTETLYNYLQRSSLKTNPCVSQYFFLKSFISQHYYDFYIEVQTKKNPLLDDIFRKDANFKKFFDNDKAFFEQARIGIQNRIYDWLEKDTIRSKINVDLSDLNISYLYDEVFLNPVQINTKKKYGALVSFSDIIFNRDKSKAVVCVGFYSHGSQESIYYMEKFGRLWLPAFVESF